MASPYTLANIVDVAATATANLLEGLRGRFLPEPSRIQVFLNREAVGILFNMTLAADQILEDATVAINAAVGVAPSTRDDLITTTFGEGGAEIVLRARNSTAGALEARCIIFVTPLDDVALQNAMASLGLN